jgi:hypothetical protein
MQPTDTQVERSLEALRDSGEAGGGEPPAIHVEVPEGLLDLLESSPPVRLDRMADAKMRLVGGRQPTDDDLARRLVGRMVCDRLR